MAKGPLAVRWGAWPDVSPEAGAIEHVLVHVENAGTITWRPELGVSLAYHWLDDRGNPIVLLQIAVKPTVAWSMKSSR